jgi:anthranilate phosphoribosyltransferase
MTIKDFAKLLKSKKDLSENQAKDLLGLLMDNDTNDEQIAEILILLSEKGESISEITGFIKGMRELMVEIESSPETIDIVGTGGDGSNSFNISTVSAIVAASCGAVVAKHGNRAASSLCGSADVLEELGVNINLNSKTAEEVLRKYGMVFLFARVFHPAMKKVGPVRKELKRRTIFNYLGPFLNPAKVRRMLLGAANMILARKLLEIAKQLEYEHVLIVTSDDGLDEISIASKTTVLELKNGVSKEFIIDPQKLGFGVFKKSELIGGDPAKNGQIVRDILDGKEQGAKRESVVLNSAYALLVSGRVSNVSDGIKMSREAIDSRKSFELLKKLRRVTNE